MLWRENGVVAELGSRPDNVRRLIELATATPIHVNAGGTTFCYELSRGTGGQLAVANYSSAQAMLRDNCRSEMWVTQGKINQVMSLSSPQSACAR